MVEKSSKVSMGFLVEEKKPTWAAYKERAELAKRRGISLFYVGATSENAERIANGEELFCRYWDGKSMLELEVECPQVFYDKTKVAFRKEDAARIIESIKRRGGLFINSPEFRELCIDKWATYVLLARNKITQPKTEVYDEDILRAFIENYDCVFIKKRNDSHGRNQFVIRNLGRGRFFLVPSDEENPREECFSSLCDFLRDRKVDSSFIIQEGINVDRVGGRVYDIRALFQRGINGRIGMTCFYVRVGPENSEQANISKGGKPQDPFVFFDDYDRILRIIRGEGHRVIGALSKSYVVGEVGIDFLLDENNVLYTIEINSNPGCKSLRTLREWKPSGEDYHNKRAIPVEYDNQIRQVWGDNLKKFLTNPLLYGKYLVESARQNKPSLKEHNHYEQET